MIIGNAKTMYVYLCKQYWMSIIHNDNNDNNDNNDSNVSLTMYVHTTSTLKTKCQ